ncbi:hypothetical protein [Aliivibrio fischeri]|uniref:Uncharacterized protein n=1 Tax=Aliivibrio fischeri SR5 TaxID=1088719 RepID=A0AAV3EM92_ALIFS|nr:hypothetical protein [Aliivibrio fischeri]EHN67993.1 hypothetical protein VFSR5_2718 [Aliivibrio fischeri SR5]
MKTFTLLILTLLSANITVAQAWEQNGTFLTQTSTNNKSTAAVFITPGTFDIALSLFDFKNTINLCNHRFDSSVKGNYKEVDAGIAEINGRYVKMIGICVDDLITEKVDWTMEIQPESPQGLKYILKELVDKKELKITFEKLGVGSYTFQSTNFEKFFSPMLKESIKKKNAI